MASANWLMRSWPIVSQSVVPRSRPAAPSELLGRCEGSRHGRRSTTPTARVPGRPSLGPTASHPRGEHVRIRTVAVGGAVTLAVLAGCSSDSEGLRVGARADDHDHGEGRGAQHPRLQRRRVLGRGHRRARRGPAQAPERRDHRLARRPTNKSGTGSKTTPGELTATEQKTKSGYPATAVNGFPADSVNYGLAHVVKTKPDRRAHRHQPGPEPRPDRVALGHRRRGEGRARPPGSRRSPPSQGGASPLDYQSAAQARRRLGDRAPRRARSIDGATVDVVNLNVPTCSTGTRPRREAGAAQPASSCNGPSPTPRSTARRRRRPSPVTSRRSSPASPR